MHLPSGPVPGFLCREARADLGILPEAAKRGFCSVPRRPVDESRGQRKEQKERLIPEPGDTGGKQKFGSKSRSALGDDVNRVK